MTIDDLGRAYGDDWFLNHSDRSELWVATLKADSTVRLSAETAQGLAAQIRERMQVWSELRS